MALSEQRRNQLRRISTLLVLLALVSPVVRDQDGLPLSTYPMYAGGRGEVFEIVVAYGVAPDGSRSALSMPEIADTRDPLIAEAFLNDAVASGSANEVCDEILARVEPRISSVLIAAERRNVLDHVAGRDSKIDSSVLARCGS